MKREHSAPVDLIKKKKGFRLEFTVGYPHRYGPDESCRQGAQLPKCCDKNKDEGNSVNVNIANMQFTYSLFLSIYLQDLGIG